MFSSFGRAIFRGIACVVSLIFRIAPKKDRVRVIVYRDDGDILLVKIVLAAKSGLYREAE